MILFLCSFAVIAAVFLGYNDEDGSPFHVPFEAFRTHFHFIGGTGKGKTTAIEAILHQLFRARERAAHFILDRMGSFSFSLLLWLASDYCPPQIRERVVYVDASREDVVLPFNPLQYTTPAHGYFKVGRACECILRAWASQNMEEMPRLARWTFNAMWAAAQLGLTVADCAHLLMPGSPYHQAILNRLPPLLMAEWAEIQNARGAEASRILESSRNRLKPYIENPILRATFGSTVSRLDVLRFMREGNIVLVNLAPQNRLSPQVADAMGGMILNEVLATARSLPLGVRYPTYLWLDEFQRFVGPDIEEAIPEVRQLGLRLCVSHQSFSQLVRGNSDLSSIIWQMQSRMILGVQGEDADILAHEVAALKYDPEKIKDEVFTRRQLLKDHEIIHMTTWSQSESAAENWSKNYGTTWSSSDGKTSTRGTSHQDSQSHGASWRIGDLQNRRYSDSRGSSASRSTSESSTRTSGHGGSEGASEGGSRSQTTGYSISESLLPIYEEFLELSRRAYYTFEEQRALWAQQIRLLKTGQALVRLVNDPKIYRVNVERHAPGYLAWPVETILVRRPEAIEAVHRFVEQNFASELFVSPHRIERETEERLQWILNPAIVIPALPAPHVALDIPPARIEENPLA